MNALKNELQKQVIKEESKIINDKWKLKFHLMPPVGWLNDPNGLCQFNGKYHVFFQYSPFDAQGGLKFWGHYSSYDLINWEYLGVPLLPDQPYDCHGVYSGSALIDNNKMHIFYTGNIKYDGNFDYINNGRAANTIYTYSEDGINFKNKVCVMENKDYPIEFTCHVRDPKVWKEDNNYYMVLGGRKKDDIGAVLLYSSQDLLNWNLENEIITSEKFGYMWECPDLFKIDNQYILSVSPQGLETQEFIYQNLYQSGYFLLNGDYKSKYSLKNFREWDMGFDFYAPQTFLDEHGRRILIGWAGMPDINDYINPTTKYGWQHILTIPRELTFKNNIILQYPVKEINNLRKDKKEILDNEVVKIQNGIFDLEIDDINSNNLNILIAKGFEIKYRNNIFEINFLNDLGKGRKTRKAKISKLESLRILCDTSIIEIFLNNGETVFTTRYYPENENITLKINCKESKNSLWNL